MAFHRRVAVGSRRIPAMDEHRSADELTAALDEIRQSPAARGTVELIVRRPAENEREVLDEAIARPRAGPRRRRVEGPREQPDAGRVGEPRRAAHPDERPRRTGDRRQQGAPAARRRPALRRSRPQHREPPGRHPPRGRRRRDRGDARAAHRLRQVQRPLRDRCPQVREQVSRAASCACAGSTPASSRPAPSARATRSRSSERQL